ncbi:MAG: decaprenyl-phosphate phosphoribosyltransferase [Bradymonadia bacterium]
MHHIKALRPHQWIKNFFVFAALIFSRNLTNLDLGLRSMLIFAAFSAVASSIYLVNDVADIERDRQHPKKKFRPIASGKVNPKTALMMGALLFPLGLGTAYWLSVPTGVVLTTYFIMNLGYSTKLKHVVLLDVFIIALGFLLRVLAGAFAIGVGVSPWLLICTLFGALFLAFCKRRNELTSLGENAGSHRAILSEYSVGYIDNAISALTAMTVMSYALYTIDPAVCAKLGTDALVLTVPLVLFGAFRYLHLVHQKDKGGSPTMVMLTDISIQGVAFLLLASAISFIYFNVQLGLGGTMVRQAGAVLIP